MAGCCLSEHLLRVVWLPPCSMMSWLLLTASGVRQRRSRRADGGWPGRRLTQRRSGRHSCSAGELVAAGLCSLIHLWKRARRKTGTRRNCRGCERVVPAGCQRCVSLPWMRMVQGKPPTCAYPEVLPQRRSARCRPLRARASLHVHTWALLARGLAVYIEVF